MVKLWMLVEAASINSSISSLGSLLIFPSKFEGKQQRCERVFPVPGKVSPAVLPPEARVVEALRGLKASGAADAAEKFM